MFGVQCLKLTFNRTVMEWSRIIVGVVPCSSLDSIDFLTWEYWTLNLYMCVLPLSVSTFLCTSFCQKKKKKKVLCVFFRYKAWNWLSCTMKDLLNIGFKITTLLPVFVGENWSGILLIYAHCSPGTLKLKVGETIFNWRVFGFPEQLLLHFVVPCIISVLVTVL